MTTIPPNPTEAPPTAPWRKRSHTADVPDVPEADVPPNPTEAPPIAPWRKRIHTTDVPDVPVTAVPDPRRRRLTPQAPGPSSGAALGLRRPELSIFAAAGFPCGPLCKNLEEDPGRKYGKWKDWNDVASLEEEQELAELLNLRNKQRGPAAPADGGPARWRGIPFDEASKTWTFTSRDQLPPAYSFTDWWSEESLEAEAKVARRHLIPWGLRGPPQGPERGHTTWRGMQWRAGSRKWMSRGPGSHGKGKGAKQGKGDKKGK